MILGFEGLKLTYPMGMHSGKLSSNKIINMSKKWPRQAKCDSCLTKGQTGIHGFSIPVIHKNEPSKIKVQHTEISEGVAALTEDMILS